MTYKDKEIEIPTLEEFKKIVLECCGEKYSAEELYKVLSLRKWKMQNGSPIKNLKDTLKRMCNLGRWRYYTKETQDKIIQAKRKIRENKIKPVINKIISEKKVPYSPYNEQLKDEKWKAFRSFIFIVRGCKCEMCGATGKLQIHHPDYIKGRKAWEYNCNEVIVLCEGCHRKAHGLPY